MNIEISILTTILAYIGLKWYHRVQVGLMGYFVPNKVKIIPKVPHRHKTLRKRYIENIGFRLEISYQYRPALNSVFYHHTTTKIGKQRSYHKLQVFFVSSSFSINPVTTGTTAFNIETNQNNSHFIINYSSCSLTGLSDQRLSRLANSTTSTYLIFFEVKPVPLNSTLVRAYFARQVVNSCYAKHNHTIIYVMNSAGSNGVD